MTENKSSMQQYAMIFGTYMGLFWILKFILVPLGLTSPFLLLPPLAFYLPDYLCSLYGILLYQAVP